jgi:hypothetical protein
VLKSSSILSKNSHKNICNSSLNSWLGNLKSVFWSNSLEIFFKVSSKEFTTEKFDSSFENEKSICVEYFQEM